MIFDSDSTYLHLCSCVTGVTTGFKSDFIGGSCTKVPERSSGITIVKAIIIGECITSCTLKEDNGELCTLKTQMVHAPSSKFRLMRPQWLRIQGIKQGVPKDKRSQFNINNEAEVLLFDNRTINFNINHDPKILFHILTVNPGIKSTNLFNCLFLHHAR